MSKLYSIKCRQSGEGAVDDWDGQILFDENGSFEGICNAQSEYKFGRALIFGCFYEDQTLELFRIPLLYFSQPLLLRGRKKGYDFTGDIYMKVCEGMMPCGAFDVTLIDRAAGFPESAIEARKQELKNEIEELKTYSENARMYYDNFTRARSKIPAGTRISLHVGK